MAYEDNKSSVYANSYEANMNAAADAIAGYNPSELERQMKERADYNKGIISEIARAGERENQINKSYQWTDNPALQGMGMSTRERLRNMEVGGARQEGAIAGMYYTARQDDLASAITAWKDAFQAKYGALKDRAEGSKNLYTMKYGEERDTVKDSQWNQEFAEKKRSNAASEAAAWANANKGSEPTDSYQRLLDGAGGWTFYKNNQKISATQYANAAGISVENAIAGSKNQDDQKILDDLRANKSDAYLKSKYPWIY